MMAEAIFTVDESGSLVRMMPSAPSNEDHMQVLVARYPELIGDNDGDLLLIRREQPIADTLTGAGRWSLDHLFVTRSGIPVLVEMKRASDTRLRREVVGQLLDYASNGVAYWQPGTLYEAFSATCAVSGIDPEVKLAEFLGEIDYDSFWDQVDSNFQAGRVKLIFVADIIPPELARIVEFLNEQMKADVRAVELRWFTGEGNITALVPRVIGETERAKTQKLADRAMGTLGRDDWIETYINPFGPLAASGSKAFVTLIEELGGQAQPVPKTQGSIYAEFQAKDRKPVYPFHLWRTRNVSLSFAYLLSRPALDESMRRRFYDQLIDIMGPLSTENLQGYPSFKVEKLADPALLKRFAEFASRFATAACADTPT